MSLRAHILKCETVFIKNSIKSSFEREMHSIQFTYDTKYISANRMKSSHLPKIGKKRILDIVQ